VYKHWDPAVEGSLDWRIEANVVWQVPPATAHEWEKAFVAVRNDIDYGVPNHEEVNYITAITRPDKKRGSFQWREVPGGHMSHWTLGDQPNQPIAVALQRRTVGGVAIIDSYIDWDDGAGWTLLGSRYAPNLSDSPYLGLAVTPHENKVWDHDANPSTPQVPWAVTAEFSNVVITAAPSPPPNPMRTIGVAVPQGGMGYWGVREVLADQTAGTPFPGRPNVLDDVVAVIEADGGTRGVVVDYTAPVINIWDSAGEGCFTPSDDYAVVTRGYRAKGSVNRLAMVASGMVNIPATDWYTFDVNSDDGFELSIDGNIVMEATGGKPPGDVLGHAYLAAGEHPIRLLYWEGSGGAEVEVMAARGAKTAYDGTFNLIGSPAGLQLVPEPATLALLGAAMGLAVVTRRRK
jgi:hypothetical protein